MVQTNSVDPQMTKLFSSNMFGDKHAASHTGAFNNLRNTETALANKPLVNDGFQMNREQSFNAELDSGRQPQKQNESLDQWAKFYNTHEDDYIFTME